jgi:hypothetical protein
VTGANKDHKLVSATQTITVDMQQHKTNALHRRQGLFQKRPWYAQIHKPFSIPSEDISVQSRQL